MALFLHESAGRAASDVEALQWLELACRCRSLFASPGEDPDGDLVDLKVRSLAAQTSIRLGRVEEGCRRLSEILHLHRRSGAVWEQLDVFLILLRTALQRARFRDPSQAEELVRLLEEELPEMIEEISDHRVARAVLLTLQEAVRSRNATPELVSEVADALQKRRLRPQIDPR